MKIYVLERDNPQRWEKPVIYLDGRTAVAVIEKEYKAKVSQLKIDEEDPNNGYGTAWCEWRIDKENYCGEALIDLDYDGERWVWRLTEIEVKMKSILQSYILKNNK